MTTLRDELLRFAESMERQRGFPRSADLMRRAAEALGDPNELQRENAEFRRKLRAFRAATQPEKEQRCEHQIASKLPSGLCSICGDQG